MRILRNGSIEVIYSVNKLTKDINKGLPTEFGVEGTFLDDVFNDLPNRFDNFLVSATEGFKKFFSPPFIKID